MDTTTVADGACAARRGEVVSVEESGRPLAARRVDGSDSGDARPADMAVLSEDWLTIPPSKVLESEVVATLMDGRVGFQSSRGKAPGAEKRPGS